MAKVRTYRRVHVRAAEKIRAEAHLRKFQPKKFRARVRGRKKERA